MKDKGLIVVVSGPAGSGKGTVMKYIKENPDFVFSISRTTRYTREGEVDGVHYYFVSKEEFKQKVDQDAFVEWEEVYNGTCYGTLRSEMERIWAKGNVIIFDVDVMGGINLKRIFGDDACSIFIKAPSIEALRERLIGRGTDSMETIEKRVAKAEFELSKAGEFDHVVVNDDLELAVEQTEQIIRNFLK